MKKREKATSEQQMEKKGTIKVSHGIKLCVALCVLVIVLALATFYIEDQTWAKKDVRDYNSGWRIATEQFQTDMESSIILPYHQNIQAGETFSIEKIIQSEDCGKTISFLSADVFLRIYVGEEQIYEFGYLDQRWFGHTPGSMLNFVDIPSDAAGKTIRIQTMSNYNNYAGNVKSMIIGNRDICILYYIRNNAVNILICIFIFIGALFLFVLFLILKMSKQNTHSVEYLSFFAVVCGFYYLIETKILTLIYGNQTLYSILVFLLLMIMPVYLSQYYKNTLFKHIGKQLDILQKCIILNCIVQIILQLLNIADFMEMAFVSHIIIGVNIFLTLMGFAKVPREFRTHEYIYEVVGITCFMIGSVIDLGRTVTGQTGDLGKYSRFGAMIFILTLIVVHVRYMIVDYTSNLQKTADLLRIEKEAAIQADKAKSSFLANMSHEIRTPINAVLGMDEMILRESSEEQIIEYAFNIESAGKSLLALINDVLDFSKIESGKMELVYVEYQLSSVINDVVNMVSERMHKKNLEFILETKESVPNLLYGDEVRIRQILLNILTNAVKYTDTGSVRLMADYELMPDKDESGAQQILLEISVTDTGRGIHSEEKEHIFDSFKRVDNNKNCTLEGTGLGLSIVKSFVDLMNGEIHVESTYGEGSSFAFSIPQKVISMEPMGTLQENYHNCLENHSYEKSFVAPDVKILVVDDNEMNLKVVTGLLKDTQLQIDTALRGKLAISMVEKTHYDAILLDHMMPDMDGIETLNILRGRNLVEHIPVIALTANAISGAREKYLSNGFQDYLSKPVSGEQLEKKLIKWLPKDKFVVQESQVKDDISDSNQIIFTRLKEMKQINMDKALSFSGNGREGVIWNMQLYRKQIESSLEKLRTFAEEKKLSEYTIGVHALKSNLALIGAEYQAGLAKELEGAGKRNDWDYVEKHHDEMMIQVKQINSQLEVIFGEDKQKNSFKRLLDKLIEATQNYDVVGMEDMKAQLKQSADADMAEVDQLVNAIDELNFDEVIHLANQINGDE